MLGEIYSATYAQLAVCLNGLMSRIALHLRYVVDSEPRTPLAVCLNENPFLETLQRIKPETFSQRTGHCQAGSARFNIRDLCVLENHTRQASSARTEPFRVHVQRAVLY